MATVDPRYEKNGERSLGSLFRELTQEIGTLLRQEAELARAELRGKAGVIGRSAAEIGAGAVVALGGFLILLHAAVYALAPVFDSLALSALVVGALALIVGGILLARARSQMKAEQLVPTQTVESLRKDAELARTGTAPPSDPHGSIR